MLRTFIAVDLSDEIRQYLLSLSGELGKHLAKSAVRWVKPDNVHLTLRFLGETAEEQLPVINEAMDRSIEGFQPFQTALGQLGCFPNPQRPRVIWIDFIGSIDQLAAIQNNLERRVVELGWKPEKRRFHPHLTIGRVKDTANVIAARMPWGKAVSSRPILVSDIHLYESRLRPTGAEYFRRYTSSLE